MASIGRVRTVMTNFPGAPGYTNLYFSLTDGLPDIAKVRTFFETIKNLIPTGAVIQVPNQGDVIDDGSGEIQGNWTSSAQTAVTCTGTGSFTGVAGAVVNWHTDGIVAGRRVRGRTFIVPLTGGQFDSEGSLATATITAIQTAAAALPGGSIGKLVVWSRPTPDRTGSSHQVTAASVPDLSAVLRSRRT